MLGFLKSIIEIRKKYNIPPENIINMDETAISYSMTNNVTLHKIGYKTISIKTQRQEKLLVSVILSICVYGRRLKLHVIFKGAKNGKIYNLLFKLEIVKNKKAIININKNAWATNYLIKDWIKTIYIHFFNKKVLSDTLLIWD